MTAGIHTTLDADAAIAMLPEGEAIHTFSGTGRGAYWERDRLIEGIRTSPGRWILEPSTGARKMGHGLAIEYPEHPGLFLFIETREGTP